jgi:SAM-dependent methyltransferase
MSDTVEQNRRNQAVYDRDCRQYLNRPLLPPELDLLRLYKNRWHETDMLDLGVGAGRTALIFAILARTYVGLDYAPRMIDLCREWIRESDAVQFVVGDACDLSPLGDRRFDAVLFSFNGIDCVDPDRRRLVLREVGKHLKRDGYFLFSSHSLHTFPFHLDLPRKGGQSLLRWAYSCAWRLQWYVKQRFHNRHIDVEEARRRGWALVADGDHGFSCRYCYVLPEYQARELQEAGFELVAVYNRDGKSIDWRNPTEDTWLHYLCRLRDTQATDQAAGDG